MDLLSVLLIAAVFLKFVFEIVGLFKDSYIVDFFYGLLLIAVGVGLLLDGGLWFFGASGVIFGLGWSGLGVYRCFYPSRPN
ncbi:hypothetical protein [Silvimonas amylolytica]|uniref:Uncharacterized protein n=1 Tax=Silvimonas amylolytica TaxID=449663 RepID=A0ABQ2PHJ2_9NEIS|nr:hypothetical protein [Silvimonas amylolytica]GGP25055.1 hypothetical protein GCM10010971_08740 [Silvimonas amylolytica]